MSENSGKQLKANKVVIKSKHEWASFYLRRFTCFQIVILLAVLINGRYEGCNEEKLMLSRPWSIGFTQRREENCIMYVFFIVVSVALWWWYKFYSWVSALLPLGRAMLCTCEFQLRHSLQDDFMRKKAAASSVASRLFFLTDLLCRPPRPSWLDLKRRSFIIY